MSYRRCRPLPTVLRSKRASMLHLQRGRLSLTSCNLLRRSRSSTPTLAPNSRAFANWRSCAHLSGASLRRWGARPRSNAGTRNTSRNSLRRANGWAGCVPRWHCRLDDEISNLRAALDWCSSTMSPLGPKWRSISHLTGACGGTSPKRARGSGACLRSKSKTVSCEPHCSACRRSIRYHARRFRSVSDFFERRSRALLATRATRAASPTRSFESRRSNTEGEISIALTCSTRRLVRFSLPLATRAV